MSTKKIKLGERVRDKISGLEGIAEGIADWRNGCRRIAIKPTELDKDGTPRGTYWCDEPDVERVKGVKPIPEQRKTGGPRPDPTR